MQLWCAGRAQGFTPHYPACPPDYSGKKNAYRQVSFNKRTKQPPPTKRHKESKTMGFREKMAPRGTRTKHTHATNRRYRDPASPISHEDDLANDGTEILHVGGGMKQPRGKLTSMRAAGLNTGQPGTGGSRSANPMGRGIASLLPPGRRARGK